MAKIDELLCRIGVTTNYRGFFYTAYAVALCVDQPERLLLVTKRLYPEAAKRYRTNWKAVERNIRTVRDIIWREKRSLLEEPAHKRLTQKSSNAQLLAILTASLKAGSPTVPGSDRTRARRSQRTYSRSKRFFAHKLRQRHETVPAEIPLPDFKRLSAFPCAFLFLPEVV